MDNEEDIQNIFINRNRFAPKVVQLPFDQALKRKVVVRSVQGSPELVRIYVKGAPEVVLPACSQTLNHQVKPKPFTQEHQQTIWFVEAPVGLQGTHGLEQGSLQDSRAGYVLMG